MVNADGIHRSAPLVHGNVTSGHSAAPLIQLCRWQALHTARVRHSCRRCRLRTGVLLVRSSQTAKQIHRRAAKHARTGSVPCSACTARVPACLPRTACGPQSALLSQQSCCTGWRVAASKASRRHPTAQAMLRDWRALRPRCNINARVDTPPRRMPGGGCSRTASQHTMPTGCKRGMPHFGVLRCPVKHSSTPPGRH